MKVQNMTVFHASGASQKEGSVAVTYCGDSGILVLLDKFVC